MEQVSQNLMVWLDALRLCVILAVLVKVSDLHEALIYNRESRFASPRGRAFAWAWVCLGTLIGAGLPFVYSSAGRVFPNSETLAQIMVFTWASVFTGFAVLTADRAKRPAMIMAAYAFLLPATWAASAVKHGAL